MLNKVKKHILLMLFYYYGKKVDKAIRYMDYSSDDDDEFHYWLAVSRKYLEKRDIILDKIGVY